MDPVQETLKKMADEIEQLRLILNQVLSNPKVIGVLELPNFDSDPTHGNVGQLVVVAGVLKICTAADTWTIVGVQS